ncbi:hypothetical protein CCR75_004688 [Bremia lactucae]|uniref:DNA 3'-5' helicase n=1 Tax=Bremia lactucae TaxID=4779 RepID=A0A976IHY4_BRELC|nr:hypothetical protein CCR75_004688 [Bremia lactucae]
MWPRRQQPNGTSSEAKNSIPMLHAISKPHVNMSVALSSSTPHFVPRKSDGKAIVNEQKSKGSISFNDDAAWMLRAFDRKKLKAKHVVNQRAVSAINDTENARRNKESGAISLAMSVQERKQIWRSGARKKPLDEAIEKEKEKNQELQEMSFDRVFREVFGKNQIEQTKGSRIVGKATLSSLGILANAPNFNDGVQKIAQPTAEVFKTQKVTEPEDKDVWDFASAANAALDLHDFDTFESSHNASTVTTKGTENAAEFERWKTEDKQSAVSSNFVRLNMCKRFKGSSGRAKKRPAYIRARIEHLPDEVVNSHATGLAPVVTFKKPKQDKVFLADDGVDFIEECLEALAKVENERELSNTDTNRPKQKIEPTEPPRCHHALVCQSLEVKKKNKNYKRRFYACSLNFDEGRCDFFLWEDDYVPRVLQILNALPSKDESAQAIECVPLDLEASEDALKDAMLTNLRLVFQHSEFRPGQEWAISRVFRQKDTLLVLPTGAGKSLCYQFPALFLPGLTLVISPLIALMNDQYESLPAPLKTRAACLSGSSDSSASKAKYAAFVRDLLAGDLSLVFLSPEKALGAGMQALLSTPCVRARLSLVCVDEAHCISEWSHHFRPSYLRLVEIFRHAQCVLCVTATASRRVVRDVLYQLRSRRPLYINSCENESDMVLQMPWKRSNLALEVRSVISNEERLRHLVHVLPGMSQGSSKGTKGGVIVYVHQQRQSEELAALLREQLPSNWRSLGKVLAYHAGMPPDAKEKVRTGFARGRVQVVVATVAFGMGIDKKNVRAVIHFHMPSSVEAYVQQIGRAGRDGKPARALLYLLSEDAIHFRSLLFSTALDRAQLRRLLTLVFQDHVNSASCVAVKYLSQQENEDFTLLTLERELLEQYLDLKAATIETFLTLLALETQKSRPRADDFQVLLQPLSMSRCTLQLLETQVKKLAPHSCSKLLFEAVQRKELPNARHEHRKDGYHSSWTIDLHLHEAAQWYAQAAATNSGGQNSGLRSDVLLDGDLNLAAVTAATNTRRMLQELRSEQQTGRIQRISLSQPAFQIQFSGPRNRTDAMSTEAIERWTTVLYAKHQHLESCQLSRLEHLYGALHAAAIPASFSTETRNEDSKVHALETSLKRYFEEEDGEIDDQDESLLTNSLRPLSATLVESIERDTRSLMQLRLQSEGLVIDSEEVASGEEGMWTSYAVAKVFHGLTTPLLLSKQWRDHIFWRRYADVAFERLVKIAHKVLDEK